MVVSRNRMRPRTSFEERLLKFAEEARSAAELIAAGPEQERLLRKALKAEALANEPIGYRRPNAAKLRIAPISAGTCVLFGALLLPSRGAS